MLKTYIIAEIGINHNGCLDTAKKLIDIAALSGCDAVKFQKRNPDVCVPEHQKSLMRETPWGEMTYLEYKKRVEFNKEHYDVIDDYCSEKGIVWSASPWDLDSLSFLSNYDLPFIKIASAMLTNHELLASSVATGSKVILSTGMSSLEEIDAAVRIINDSKIKYKNTNRMCLMHCNSSYPAPLSELNLSCIPFLLQRYPDYDIGYSGHEFRLGTSVSAIYLGASVIERHITLDRTMWGSDHMASVEPQGLIKLVKGIRELEESYGVPEIRVTESEIPIRHKLRG